MKKESRRQFLKGTLGMLGGAMTAQATRLFPELQPILAQMENPISPTSQTPGQISDGELFEGLLLLPEEGSPLPSFVQCAPAPILGQMDEQYDSAYRGEYIWFNNVDELAKDAHFPIYVPSKLPRNVSLVSAYLIRFLGTGEIFMACTEYGENSANPVIKVWARPKYPRPYPIWPVRYSSVQNEAPPILPEKVTFSPLPGVLRPTASGHLLEWIENDILYSLVEEHESGRRAVETIAGSLIQH